jgi:hypothetical protein
MNIRQVPARTGLDWIREGGRLFAARPLVLSGLVGVYLAMVLLPTLVPVVGPAVAGILEPFATLSVMMACRETAAGRLPTITLFAAPFTDRLRRVELLRLGMLYAGLAILVALLFELLDPVGGQEARGGAPSAVEVPATPSSAGPPADPGVLPAVAPSADSATPPLTAPVTPPVTPPVTSPGAASVATPANQPATAADTRTGPSPTESDGGPDPTPTEPPAGAVAGAPEKPADGAGGSPAAAAPLHVGLLLIEALLLVPLIMARWFAPILVGWHLMSPVKAMFFSFFACWRNRLPLLLWGACVLGIAALGSAVLAFLAAMVGLTQPTASVLVAPWALAMVAYIQATVYPMYRSIVEDAL